MTTTATLQAVLSILPDYGDNPMDFLEMEKTAREQHNIGPADMWAAMIDLERDGMVRSVAVRADNGGPDWIRWQKAPQKKVKA